jgi:hypothetical protein
MLFRALMSLVCAAMAWGAARRAFGPDRGAEAAYLAGDFARAVALNPRHSRAWIAQGLAAESRGDRAAAEAALLRAAAVDRSYLPAWTLANFYLRAGGREEFWRWSRRAAEMAYEPDALFALLWRVSGDGAEILERAIPESGAARRAYLAFLARTGRAAAAGTLPAEILARPRPGDDALLLDYCDAAIAAGLAREAALIWNAVGSRARGRCFDWRIPRVPGAAVSFDPVSGELTVSLSGKQPETCDLAEKYEPVESAAVTYDDASGDLPAPSGLEWRYEKTAAGLGRAVLRYRRPPGFPRAEGTAVFRGLAIGPER